MIHTVNDGWQLWVYWKGQIIYKRWLKKGYGCVMELYGPNTFTTDRAK